MKKNMGLTDKVTRFLVAAVVLTLYFTHVISGTLAIVLLILSVVFILTSFISFCPLYLPLGISTRRNNNMIQFLKNIFGGGQSENIGEKIAQGAIIIDVRTQREYQSGHLRNSINIPLDKLPDNLNKIDKSKVIITCCASGMRSYSAKNILKNNGFGEVYNGGSWNNLTKFER